jgi:hypothetical protein
MNCSYTTNIWRRSFQPSNHSKPWYVYVCLYMCVRVRVRACACVNGHVYAYVYLHIPVCVCASDYLSPASCPLSEFVIFLVWSLQLLFVRFVVVVSPTFLRPFSILCCLSLSTRYCSYEHTQDTNNDGVVSAVEFNSYFSKLSDQEFSTVFTTLSASRGDLQKHVWDIVWSQVDSDSSGAKTKAFMENFQMPPFFLLSPSSDL